MIAPYPLSSSTQTDDAPGESRWLRGEHTRGLMSAAKEDGRVCWIHAGGGVRSGIRLGDGYDRHAARVQQEHPMPTEDEMFVAASRLALRGHLTTYAGYVPPDVERMLHEVAECLAIAEPGMVEVMSKARREKGERGKKT